MVSLCTVGVMVRVTTGSMSGRTLPLNSKSTIWMFAMEQQLPVLHITVSTVINHVFNLKLNVADNCLSPCLAQRLGDDGSKHSQVHGFSIDGFPIYGSYQSSGTPAVSCWQKRDYRSNSPTGCPYGSRSCVLKDPLDYKKGTKWVYSGPSFTSTVNSLSGNPISSACGVYMQDYFYNAT